MLRVLLLFALYYIPLLWFTFLMAVIGAYFAEQQRRSR
jgi:hypothetical protein